MNKIEGPMSIEGLSLAVHDPDPFVRKMAYEHAAVSWSMIRNMIKFERSPIALSGMATRKNIPKDIRKQLIEKDASPVDKNLANNESLDSEDVELLVNRYMKAIDFTYSNVILITLAQHPSLNDKSLISLSKHPEDFTRYLAFNNPSPSPEARILGLADSALSIQVMLASDLRIPVDMILNNIDRDGVNVHHVMTALLKRPDCPSHLKALSDLY